MPKSWPKGHVDALAAYVADLQVEMGLHAWHLRVMGGPAPKPHRGSLAVTWMANESNEANIYVNERFFALTRYRRTDAPGGTPWPECLSDL